MCGIVGFVGPPDRETLIRMRDCLSHRGPDEAGIFEESRVSLGHRRLAIVDLKSGQQPAFNEDRSVVITFNGEIYNHPALMPELKKLGHRYTSHCDTETIVHAYEEFGFDCLKHLDGMFAFVLYDQRKQLLFGARDRLGKKPIYYSLPIAQAITSSASFLFASELKALRNHPDLTGVSLSENALVDYLLNDYVVGTHCIDNRVQRLLPGSAFCFGLANSAEPGFRTWRYWDFQLRPTVEPASIAEAVEKTRSLLSAATQSRLMADVPVGCFLSGGIDSSSLVAMLRMHLPAEQVSTYSIGFDESSFDESAYAERTARHFGTRHHCRRFTVAEMLGRIDSVSENLDEPFGDPSILPVAMLSEFAREHVKVALGGDGGDELFAGYDPFRAIAPAWWYRRLVPKSVNRMFVRPIARHLPASSENMPFAFRVDRFLRGLEVSAAIQNPAWMGPFSLLQLKKLIPDWAVRFEAERVFAPQFDSFTRLEKLGGDDLDQSIDFFERFYLPDDILVKVDRASMMHSLEVRSPFLDTALVEFVNQLPNHWKLRGGKTKYLFKLAMMQDEGTTKSWPTLPLPKEIVHRKKKGFGIPVAHWIRHELKSLFRERLIDDWPKSLSMFDRRFIGQLLDEHQRGRANRYKELWALFMLAQWARFHGPK